MNRLTPLLLIIFLLTTTASAGVVPTFDSVTLQDSFESCDLEMLDFNNQEQEQVDSSDGNDPSTDDHSWNRKGTVAAIQCGVIPNFGRLPTSSELAPTLGLSFSRFKDSLLRPV